MLWVLKGGGGAKKKKGHQKKKGERGAWEGNTAEAVVAVELVELAELLVEVILTTSGLSGEIVLVLQF